MIGWGHEDRGDGGRDGEENHSPTILIPLGGGRGARGHNRRMHCSWTVGFHAAQVYNVVVQPTRTAESAWTKPDKGRINVQKIVQIIMCRHKGDEDTNIGTYIRPTQRKTTRQTTPIDTDMQQQKW